MRTNFPLPCLLLALSGCISAPAIPPASTSPGTMTEHTTETRFTTPADFAATQAAAGAAFDPAAYRVPDVQGLRLGTFAGMPALLVEAQGARAAIAVHGGHLLSWLPDGHEDVLWLSPALAPAPAAIRGGVPVIWPYFGRQGQGDDVPSHGFARTVRWQIESARRDADGSLRLTLAPPALVGLPLTLRMELHVGATLEQRLVTTNTGDAPVVFTQALHSYFRVADATQAAVRGLDAVRFRDKVTGESHIQLGDRLSFIVGGRYSDDEKVVNFTNLADTSPSASDSSLVRAERFRLLPHLSFLISFFTLSCLSAAFTAVFIF